MAKTTFAVVIGAGWTIVVDGAAYSSVGVISADGQIVLAIASSVPASTSNDYIPLPRDGFSTELGTGDKLYAKAQNGQSTIRGYREAV